MLRYEPAVRPTLYFIGVSTGRSSIRKVFPAWAAYLNLDAVLCGIDVPLSAPRETYRRAVEFIRADRLSLGALVTTHKIDLFEACEDLFDDLDPHAASLREISCISKRAGRLVCHAKDPISVGLALDGFLPADHFRRTGADVFAIGAGGSTIALGWHLMHRAGSRDRPARLIVSDCRSDRLAAIQRVHATLHPAAPLTYALAQRPEDNDRLVGGLRAGSLIVNASGRGKDVPGSPLTSAANFPAHSIAWDFNYRGDLLFLDQARVQPRDKQIRTEDGWTYFIHGWLQVIAEVFQRSIPPSGAAFDELARIALKTGRGAQPPAPPLPTE
jgi:shikimate 5-dehydrogenase